MINYAPWLLNSVYLLCPGFSLPPIRSCSPAIRSCSCSDACIRLSCMCDSKFTNRHFGVYIYFLLLLEHNHILVLLMPLPKCIYRTSSKYIQCIHAFSIPTVFNIYLCYCTIYFGDEARQKDTKE